MMISTLVEFRLRKMNSLSNIFRLHFSSFKKNFYTKFRSQPMWRKQTSFKISDWYLVIELPYVYSKEIHNTRFTTSRLLLFENNIAWK